MCWVSPPRVGAARVGVPGVSDSLIAVDSTKRRAVHRVFELDEVPAMRQLRILRLNSGLFWTALAGTPAACSKASA